MIGTRFDQLTVLRRDKKWSRKLKWICRCNCGKEISEYARNLQRKDSKAIRACKECKKKIPKNRKPVEDVLFNRLFWLYKQQAKYRNKPFHLTFEQSVVLFKGACRYCGRFGVRKFVVKNLGEIFVNGIDRVNPAKGYESSNVASCCMTCNFMKHKLTHEEFLQQLDRIHSFQSSMIVSPGSFASTQRHRDCEK